MQNCDSPESEFCRGSRVILATGRFIGEGFDDPHLDTLFLALPVSWRGTIAQNVGRLPPSTMANAKCRSLCAEAGLVVELDGAQHLADADAYRRDRRKDALLQQYGYFVLRFLADDIGKRLDSVLDTIIAALVHRPDPGGCWKLSAHPSASEMQERQG